MSDTSFQGAWTKPKTEDVALPAPVPFAAPVLIGDCVTPLGGETVLSLLLRRFTSLNEEGRDKRGLSDSLLVTRKHAHSLQTQPKH